MARQFTRIQRVADVMHRELAKILSQEFKDPRIGMVTILDLEVARDLGYAKVFISILEEDKVEVTLKTLNAAAGFFRSQLAKTLNLRTTPKLQFIYDDSSKRGVRISQLIDEALKDLPPSDDDQ